MIPISLGLQLRILISAQVSQALAWSGPQSPPGSLSSNHTAAPSVPCMHCGHRTVTAEQFPPVGRLLSPVFTYLILLVFPSPLPRGSLGDTPKGCFPPDVLLRLLLPAVLITCPLTVACVVVWLMPTSPQYSKLVFVHCFSSRTQQCSWYMVDV